MKKKPVLMSLILLVGLFTASCGEEGSGNSTNTTPADSIEELASADEITTTPSEGTGTTSREVLPTIDFSLPSSISSNRTAVRKFKGPRFPSNSTVIEHWAERMNRSIEKNNELIAKLNEAELDETGAFTGEGRRGNISGMISELTDDPVYQHEALICNDNEAFLTIKWNTDQSQIETVRNFHHKALETDESAGFFGKMLYTQSEEGETLEMRAHGTPWRAPEELVDEDQMTQYTYGHKASDGTMTLKSVQDWYTDVPESFTGDGYLTGKLESDGSGEYVAYRSFKDECTAIVFDENAVTGDSWCLGKAVDSDTDYTAEELSQAWDRLQTVGVALQSNLQSVALETNLSCP